MYFDTLCLGKGNVQPVTCKKVMIYKETKTPLTFQFQSLTNRLTVLLPKMDGSFDAPLSFIPVIQNWITFN